MNALYATFEAQNMNNGRLSRQSAIQHGEAGFRRESAHLFDRCHRPSFDIVL